MARSSSTDDTPAASSVTESQRAADGREQPERTLQPPEAPGLQDAVEAEGFVFRHRLGRDRPVGVGATLATALKQSQGVTINEAARARTIGEAP